MAHNTKPSSPHPARCWQPFHIPRPHITWVVLRSALDFTRQLLQCLSLRLGNEAACENASEHERRVDLHDMVEPRRVRRARLSAPCSEGTDENLCDNGTNLSGSRRDSVGRASVPSWEDLTRYNKGRCVGTEVEEELREDVECQKGISAQGVVGEADDDENGSEKDEADNLDGFAANCVDGCD